ncbi:sigma-70 family RNA polymerase sigma factor [Duganella guangzhouensis]|uniref:sigma-70 family RNA polymerase sigma factor n=1 Tax=Duganella guangzhouensis TaxID=2666084 RepID=UPI002804DB37|nr:sigma-70 family RNA polymerase sigma factor [Duganella guangzhouensis]
MQADLASLYGEHHGWLLGWLRKRLGCAHFAADVAQDTFLRLVAVGEKLPPLAEPRAFLTTTAKRLLIDHSRRQAVEQAYLAELQLLAEQLPCFPAPDEILIAVQSLARIADALEQLPARPREAFVMHFLDGEAHAVIAERLGVSTRMVHKYLVQALVLCDAAVGQPCL